MSKAEPTIQKYMTCDPQTIDGKEPVVSAQKSMEELGIRHLPVMDGDQLIGVLSDRDIKAALSILDSTPDLLCVKDICHERPYHVNPETPLHEVLNEMAEQHLGSALVVQNNKLVGIFTTIDACEGFAKILTQRFHEHS